MTDSEKLIAYVEHEGGAASAIPDPQAYRESGLCWRLRYAPTKQALMAAASVIDTLQYLLDPHVTAKDACARLRELRREYARLAKGENNGR